MEGTVVNREKVYVLGVTRGVCSLAESEGPGERNQPPVIPWLPFPGGPAFAFVKFSVHRQGVLLGPGYSS